MLVRIQPLFMRVTALRNVLSKLVRGSAQLRLDRACWLLCVYGGSPAGKQRFTRRYYGRNALQPCELTNVRALNPEVAGSNPAGPMCQRNMTGRSSIGRAPVFIALSNSRVPTLLKPGSWCVPAARAYKRWALLLCVCTPPGGLSLCGRTACFSRRFCPLFDRNATNLYMARRGYVLR